MFSDTTTIFAQIGFDDTFQGPTGTAFHGEARFYDGLALPPSFDYGFNNPDTAPAGQLLATPWNPNLPTTFATQAVDRWWFAP